MSVSTVSELVPTIRLAEDEAAMEDPRRWDNRDARTERYVQDG